MATNGRRPCYGPSVFERKWGWTSPSLTLLAEKWRYPDLISNCAAQFAPIIVRALSNMCGVKQFKTFLHQPPRSGGWKKTSNLERNEPISFIHRTFDKVIPVRQCVLQLPGYLPFLSNAAESIQPIQVL
jgi:hypothetical protein